MEHLDMQTPDGNQLNLDALYKICPSCFTESKDKEGKLKRVVDWAKLRALLGDNAVEDAPEVYDFTWVGKRAAQREAAKPINKTLRPCPEESVDWDTTQNLYIEGDNLEVLKLLQNSYMGKVKMIYIDPPYNTGNDFVYHDDFAQSAEEYDEHNRDEEGNRFRKNTDSNGRFHSDWCSMMYSRLMVARSLLREDGVIFISIDENEVRNLRNICDEVFGEHNYCSNFLWKKKSTTSNVKGAEVSSLCDNTLCYKRTPLATINPRVKPSSERDYQYSDEEGNYRLTIIEKKDSGAYKRDSMKYPIMGHFPREGKRWQIGIDKAQELEKKERFVFDGEKILLKIYDFEDHDSTSAQPNLLDFCGSTDSASQSVNQGLFGNAELFDNPKPTELIQHLSKISTNLDSLIVDFFSGSATSAHAVMQLNAEDQGKRKFIMVQLQEETSKDSEAYKAGYKSICEIGKERIRRAGKKIKEEHPEAKDLDVGFRVLKCDESNMKDVYFSPKELQQGMLDFMEDNIKEDRSDLDLLFDCMLRWGVELSLPMTTTQVDGCTIHNVNDGDLLACFAGTITDKVVSSIAAQHPHRVVFRDSSFTDASQKMNLFEQFKQLLSWSDQEVRNNVKVI